LSPLWERLSGTPPEKFLDAAAPGQQVLPLQLVPGHLSVGLRQTHQAVLTLAGQGGGAGRRHEDETCPILF